MATEKLKDTLYQYYSTSTGYLHSLNDKDPDYFNDYARLVREFVKEKSSIILDLGCGPGISTKLIKQYYPNTFGSDISFLFLKEGHVNSNYASDAHQSPIKDGIVNAVCSFEFIEHVYDAEKVLSEMIRVTKKNGLIIIMSPNLYSPLIPIRAFLNYLRKKNGETPWTPTFFSTFTRFFGNCFMLVKKKFSKKYNFYYRTPDLTKIADQGGDYDSVFMSNPVDIVKYLKDNGFLLLSVSVGRSRVGKIISKYFPSCATGMAIVAQKIN